MKVRNTYAPFILITLAFIALTMVFNLTLISAITGSIGNARMVLYPEVGFLGTTIEKSILVKNVNNVSINITMVADNDLKDIVKVIDSSFMLAPGEEKNAAFEINLRKPGNYSGKINVFFTPLGTKTGVALSSNIIIFAKKKGLWDDSGDNSDANLNNTNSISGSAILSGIRIKLSPITMVLISTTLVLIILLVVLFIVANKKNKKEVKTVKLNKRKRSDRSS